MPKATRARSNPLSIVSCTVRCTCVRPSLGFVSTCGYRMRSPTRTPGRVERRSRPVRHDPRIAHPDHYIAPRVRASRASSYKGGAKPYKNLRNANIMDRRCRDPQSHHATSSLVRSFSSRGRALTSINHSNWANTQYSLCRPCLSSTFVSKQNLKHVDLI